MTNIYKYKSLTKFFIPFPTKVYF